MIKVLFQHLELLQSLISYNKQDGCPASSAQNFTIVVKRADGSYTNNF